MYGEIPAEYQDEVERIRFLIKLTGKVVVIDYSTFTYRGGWNPACYDAVRCWRVVTFENADQAYHGWPRRRASYASFENLKTGLSKWAGIAL